MENIFVVTDGSYGITETSAANLCAIASQVKAEAEQTIENVSFVNNDINIIGSGNENFMRVSAGYTNTNDIKKALDVICKMNSFISWFAEARKQIEDYRNKFTQITFADYCKEKNIEIPQSPQKQEEVETTEEDIINKMPIKERQEYLQLEAESAALGKAIHKDGTIQKARLIMHKVNKAPYSTDGTGKDLVVTKSTLSIDTQSVDELYNQLQATYRKKEQHLNKIKSDIKNSLNQAIRDDQIKNSEINLKWSAEYKIYQQEYKNLMMEYNSYVKELEAKAAKFKIAVPDKLKETMNELNSLVK